LCYLPLEPRKASTLSPSRLLKPPRCSVSIALRSAIVLLLTTDPVVPLISHKRCRTTWNLGLLDHWKSRNLESGPESKRPERNYQRTSKSRRLAVIQNPAVIAQPVPWIPLDIRLIRCGNSWVKNSWRGDRYPQTGCDDGDIDSLSRYRINMTSINMSESQTWNHHGR
jgi:hypothetical protein